MKDIILANVDISPFNLEHKGIVKRLAEVDLSNAICDNVTEEQLRRVYE